MTKTISLALSLSLIIGSLPASAAGESRGQAPRPSIVGAAAPGANFQLDAAGSALAGAGSIARLGVEQASGIGRSLLGETSGAAAQLALPVSAMGAGVAFAPSGLGNAQPPADPAAAAQPAPAPETPEAKPFFHRYPLLAKLLIQPLIWLFYRIEVEGVENLPEGPAVLAPNHPSYAEPVLVGLKLPQPARFMMYRAYYDKAPRLMRAVGAIPISGEDTPGGMKEAFRSGRRALQNGEKVVIFPEGGRTYNGTLRPFQRGFELMAKGTSAPVVPIHVDGLWGSALSRAPGTFWQKLKFRRRVTIRIGTPIEKATPQLVREAVQVLSADAMGARMRRDGKSLPRRLLETAKKHWKARAVADSQGKDLTNGEMLTGALLLSRRLRAQSSQTNVGVLLPPSAGAALTNVALTIAGKVPVNINYASGPAVVAYALKKAKIDTIITSRKAVEAFQKLKEWNGQLPPGNLVYLEDILPTISERKKKFTYVLLRVLPRRIVEGLFWRHASRNIEDNATLLFTSGSGSDPKGVVLSHLNLRANVQMVADAFTLKPNDLILGTLPFSHSFGLTATMWFPMTMGVPVGYHTSPLEPEAIGELATTLKPTMFFTVPNLLVLYARKIKKESFASLRVLLTGAAELTKDVADLFEKRNGIRPMQGYGATELSPVDIVSLPNVTEMQGGKEVVVQYGNRDGSVGVPLPGTAHRVVDVDAYEKALETGGDVTALPSLPDGTPGALLAYGPHVMKEYFEDPAKTAAAKKNGWYLTGDMAVLNADGTVDYKGRLARFSKISGEMVSQIAVEEALQKAAGLTDLTFVVVGVPDASRGERLAVAYIDAGWNGDIEGLLKKASANGLPALWTPGRGNFHKIAAIPMLGSGKYDFKAIKKAVLELENTP